MTLDTLSTIKKIKKKLLWTPKLDFNSGLEKTIEWYLQNLNWCKKILKKKKYKLQRLGIAKYYEKK